MKLLEVHYLFFQDEKGVASQLAGFKNSGTVNFPSRVLRSATKQWLVVTPIPSNEWIQDKTIVSLEVLDIVGYIPIGISTSATVIIHIKMCPFYLHEPLKLKLPF